MNVRVCEGVYVSCAYVCVCMLIKKNAKIRRNKNLSCHGLWGYFKWKYFLRRPRSMFKNINES